VTRLPLIKPTLLVAVLSFFAGPLGAQQTITLDNGDRLTGTLKQIDGGSWIFTYGGQDVSIPVDEIAGLLSPEAIGVRLTDGTIDAATIAPAPGGLALTFAAGTRTVAPGEIAAVGSAADLEALAPVEIGFLTPFGRFWVANLAFGFSDKSGNSRARGLSSTLDVERRTTKDRITLGFGVNRESSQTSGGDFENTVSKYYGSLRLDVFVNPKFFFFASTRQERDRFQDIALRSTYNTGLGYQAVAQGATDLDISFAGGVRRENFISAGSETATVVSAASKLRHDFGPMVLLWQADFSPKVEDLADFRFVSDASVTAPLFLGIGFRLSVLDEFTNKPQPGIKKNDLLVATRLSYTIGQ
jgi:putative salt-induced outer membrane protein YdiY